MNTSPNIHSYELSTDRVLYISKLLCSFMREKKPFLQSRYGIRNLAEDINIPSYQLSAFINRYLSVNFTDYLNQHRVKYCEELMQNGRVAQFNLKGLAMECGFYNRNTFTLSFKKFTGFTPSRYQGNMRQRRPIDERVAG